MIDCDEKNLYIRPLGYLEYLKVGDLISIDFDSVLLSVKDINPLASSGHIICKVVIGGVFGNNKAVGLVDREINLPYMSEKDREAVSMGKKHGIKVFTLSFVGSKEDINTFRELYPEATLYAKIETKKGVENLHEIIEASDGILIDRGDLSKEIPVERISIAQKIIVNKCKEKNKPVFVATHILESMITSMEPTKSEISDITNTVLDGVDGLALTKETAAGKHPIETVNVLINLCKHAEFALGSEGEKDSGIKRLEEIKYITSDNIAGLLVEPHGGTLVDRQLKTPPSKTYLDSLPSLEIDEEVLMDVEQIGIGTYSPLTGFLNEKEFNSVLDEMRLTNKVPWTVPIILQISEEQKNNLEKEKQVVLTNKEKSYAILNIEEIYQPNKEECVKKWFGTTDLKHPGVSKIMNEGDYFIGGEIDLIKRTESENKFHEITPSQTRKIFTSKGWSKVVGFHTRNVIHRSHEYIQLEGMRRGNCDGLFVHPVIGKKKSGDFNSKYIIESYQLMMDKFYPKNKVLFGTYSTFSRYAGPREAVFTAICRKNFGCSHFIVGRDHTGVGDFYGPHDAHKIFDKFPDLGINPIKFDNIVYCEECKDHIPQGNYSTSNCNHDKSKYKSISGTQARELLDKGESPPEWFMRPEVSNMIVESIKKGEEVFVK